MELMSSTADAKGNRVVPAKSYKQQNSKVSKKKGIKHPRRGRSGRRTKEMVEIAKERMRILLAQAENEIIQNRNYIRARRYVILARKLGMRYNVRIEKYYRSKICRSCNSFLITSSACRIRCQGGKIIYCCKTCGNIMRIPLGNRQQIHKIFI
jgi:ribonuclease P protein subunit RPR2